MNGKEITAISVSGTGTLEDLQVRLARVEELLGLKSEGLPTVAEKTLRASQPLGTVVVKGDRSVFHGQNDRVTLLNQFSEVKDILNGMSADDQIQAWAKQVKFLQNKSVKMTASPDSLVEHEFSLALLKLREFLPPKHYCDRLVSIYVNHFERTMRVLHIPTFMRQYEQLWREESIEAYNPASILPQVTAVMSMAYHMDDARELGEGQPHRFYLKGAALDLVQAWVDELTRKQRTELSTLQVEILLLLAKSLRYLHPEKLWSSTGALVRSGMVMGLNMDPSAVKGFTPYQIEMRRRIWTTILEIDLQASVATGMPTVLPELDPACLTPSNLNDSDFNENSASLPASQPLDTYTDNIYQVILASSLPERLKALSLVQRSTPDVEVAVGLGRKVEECIKRKPQIVHLDNHNEIRPLDAGTQLHRVLLDLYLRRPILCLYKPLLLHQDPSTPTDIYTELNQHCLASSVVILSYQDLYTLPALRTITQSPLAHQNFFYRCCKMDVLWAALNCCQAIRRGSADSSSTLTARVKSTIECLIDRIGQKGSDLKDIVFLALALESVQLSDPSLNRAQALQRVVKKTLAACRERLLQPMVAHQPQSSTTRNQGVEAAMIVTPPMSYPAPTNDLGTKSALSSDYLRSNNDWFGELPDLAAEYTNFEASTFGSADLLDFGNVQDWNWEHMWQ
ncbi:hypothetical protein FB567DRAFT_597167 [Paraphoma chrysanthemicola]|uniref:Xylanolytic transcriptional activator regulatory domain-containing protein n=1 Tax=Paraphoma chrysanthemicola TaxID=798071 RepID=A0A8K0QWJ5_9PLEO|nr:hypothetical protein FB567DRAFT_597167 [Paraphoma chrysanthemicola]